MTTAIQLGIVGLVSGAIYTLLAQGIVVVHRSSGIVNFSEAAFAVIAGFMFAPLLNKHGWSAWPAFAVIVAGGAIVGVVMYFVAIRPLRSASQLTQTMATLAVLLILQGYAAIEWGGNSVLVSPILPTGLTTIGKVVIDHGQMILVGVACLLTLVLWLASRFTLVGLALQGMAENARATAASGWSAANLGILTWGLAGALGAGAGILIAPITGVQATNMTALLLAALTAALLGGFRSFPLTLAAAMLTGILQSEGAYYISLTGVSDAIPFLLLVVALVARGRGVPTRGYIVERAATIGSGVVRPRIFLPAMVILAVLLAAVFGDQLVLGITSSLAFAIVLVSIVLLTGLAGQISLAQMAFAGIGALIAGRLVSSAGLSLVPAALVSVLVTVPVGFVFAVPALRTRGITLAVVTFGLGAAVSAMIFGNGSIIGGSLGTTVAPQSVLGWGISAIDHPQRYAIIVLIAFTLCALAVANLRRSRVGRRLIAVRSNERAAASLGVNVYSVKLYAFGVAAAIAAIGGILMAFQFETIDYSVFDPFASVLATSYTVVGGVGYVGGALQGSVLAPGGFAAWIFSNFGTTLSSYLSLIGGVALLIMLLQNPNGLQSELVNRRLLRRLLPARSPAASIPAPTTGELERVRPSVLEIRDLAVHFGGVKAVDGVSLTLRPGCVSGLIGPNGSGKTTVIDAVTGFVRPTRGQVILDDVRIDGLPVYRRARAGVIRLFQSLELFEGVSVRENLLSAAESQDSRAYLSCFVAPNAAIDNTTMVAAIEEFGLGADLDKLPSQLSYGRRRLVGIARAVASSPSVLLLDEPVAGLDDNEAAECAEFVRGLAVRWGIAILVVEHDMTFVMGTCDDLTVINSGRQIASGTPDEVRRDPAVIAAYLGESSQDDGRADQTADAGSLVDAAAGRADQEVR